MTKKPSAKPYVYPIIVGAVLGLLAAFSFAWLSATQFENYSFAARLDFQPHLVSEAERLRREAALLIGAQSIVDNGLDFAFRGAAIFFFLTFISRETDKKLRLSNHDLVYFFLGSRPFSIAGFMSSSFLEISLMVTLGLVAIFEGIAIALNFLSGLGGLFHL